MKSIYESVFIESVRTIWSLQSSAKLSVLSAARVLTIDEGQDIPVSRRSIMRASDSVVGLFCTRLI